MVSGASAGPIMSDNASVAWCMQAGGSPDVPKSSPDVVKSTSFTSMHLCRLYTAQAQAVELPAVVRYGAQDGGTCSVTFPVDARSPGTAPRCVGSGNLDMA